MRRKNCKIFHREQEKLKMKSPNQTNLFIIIILVAPQKKGLLNELWCSGREGGRLINDLEVTKIVKSRGKSDWIRRLIFAISSTNQTELHLMLNVWFCLILLWLRFVLVWFRWMFDFKTFPSRIFVFPTVRLESSWQCSNLRLFAKIWLKFEIFWTFMISTWLLLRYK